MAQGGHDDYEETWDPIKIGIALFIAFLVITMVGFGIYIFSKVSEQRAEKQICLNNARFYGNYLRAISTQDQSLCTQTGNPPKCIAEITGDVNICLGLTTQHLEEKCLFAATKERSYCKEEDAMCRAKMGDDSGCQALEDFERDNCIAISKKDANLYLSNKEEECHDHGWQVVFDTSSQIIASPFRYLYDEYL